MSDFFAGNVSFETALNHSKVFRPEILLWVRTDYLYYPITKFPKAHFRVWLIPKMDFRLRDPCVRADLNLHHNPVLPSTTQRAPEASFNAL